MPLDTNEDTPSLSALSTCEQRFVTEVLRPPSSVYCTVLAGYTPFCRYLRFAQTKLPLSLVRVRLLWLLTNIRALFYSYIYCPVLCVTCTADRRETVCLLASGFKPQFVKPATIIPPVHGCTQFFPRSFACISPKLLKECRQVHQHSSRSIRNCS